MNEAPNRKAAEAAWSKQAVAQAEQLAKRAVEGDVLAEVVSHRSQWVDCRTLHIQTMRVWQAMTTLTLAVGADGTFAGWLVEKRKASSTISILTDPEVEARARTVAAIPFDWKPGGVRRVQVDKEHGHAVATFTHPTAKQAVEVFLNQTSGELIGWLPVASGAATPQPLDDDRARAATELLWKRLQSDLATRVSAEAANQAREVLKLTPVSATVDGAGRGLRVYRLWQFYSNCEVSIDEITSETVAWYIEALRDDATERRLSETDAVQLARQEGKPASSAAGPKVTFKQEQGGERASVYWWHTEGGLIVEGDQVAVALNATTGKAFSLARKWRRIAPELLKEPKITAERAVQLAAKAVSREVPPAASQKVARGLIQVASNPDQAGPVRELQVWKVGFPSPDRLSFTEVSVETQTGEIVRTTGW